MELVDLKEALMVGNVEKAKRELKRLSWDSRNYGVDLRPYQAELSRALMFCAKKGYSTLIPLLLKCGVQVECLIDDKTALLLACEVSYKKTSAMPRHEVLNRSLMVAEQLCKHKANINRKFDGEPMVFSLIRREKKQMLELFLRHYVDLSVTNEDGWNAFEYAASLGRQRTLLILLKNEKHTNSEQYKWLAAIAEAHGHTELAGNLKILAKANDQNVWKIMDTILKKRIKVSKKEKRAKEKRAARAIRYALGDHLSGIQNEKSPSPHYKPKIRS